MGRLAGFPTSFGNKRAGVITKVGPNPYVAGGFTVEAREIDIHAIDYVDAESGSATYFAEAYVVTDDATKPVAVSNVKVKVYLSSTGAEAGSIDLSGVVFRIFGIGL